ncbi:hypothetical protein K402DRAFT_416340 [Aulographum hederae CBS 113979]|uniref:Uncharacterized protein n=1 Tax=Aulographum hederae CBS 113979 TaxID=1176131 RepID=A0A6G1HFV3_9PEZI|nr:hypothetical protein K402DRAFT_416340 [Aulographum hederae CBS 113979]
MAPISALISKACLLTLLVGRAFAQDDGDGSGDDETPNPCVSYGMDFQDGGEYFQNSLSNSSFSFVSQFQGCSNDVALNLFVDPNGEQMQCSDTNLQPDDTNQLATCPMLKNELWTGDWSVVIISNNGDARPIAYQRDFSLDVAAQETTTFTPTVTIGPISETVVQNVTTSTTFTTDTTLPVVTTTVKSTVTRPPKTVTPAKVTVTSTKTYATITKIRPTVQLSIVTKSKTMSCKLPIRASTTDKTCTIVPTVVSAAALASTTAADVPERFRLARLLKERAAIPGAGFDKERFVRERREYLAANEHLVVKRDIDLATVTVTDTDSANYPTSTSVVTLTKTATMGVTATSTATITPPAVTILKGTTVLPRSTVTAPTPTRRIVKYTIQTNFSTKTFTRTVTVTSEIYPEASVSACISKGGVII